MRDRALQDPGFVFKLGVEVWGDVALSVLSEARIAIASHSHARITRWFLFYCFFFFNGMYLTAAAAAAAFNSRVCFVEDLSITPACAEGVRVQP